MPRHWLRNLASSMKQQQVRRRIRKAAATQSAMVQSLEQRVLLAAPRVAPGSSSTLSGLGENIGVDTGVTGVGMAAVSNNYVDQVTGVISSNTSNGHYVGRFRVDAGGDAGQVVTSATVPGLNSNSPFSVNFDAAGQFVEVYVNNFEQIDFERFPSISFSVDLRDNAMTPETATITVTVNLTNRNDIPYITLDGAVDGSRDFQDFSIIENAPAGTVTTGTDSINAGGILHARTAVTHSVNGNTNVSTNMEPNTPQAIPGNGERDDLSGITDTISGDGSEFSTLRYQILRASSTTVTQGVSMMTSEVQRIVKDFSLNSGLFLIGFESDRTVSTVTQGVTGVTSEVQQLDFGNTQSGFYTLTFTTTGSPSNSFTTGPIFYTATAAQVQAELERLPGVGTGNVQVRDLVNVVQTTKGGVGVSEVQSLNLTSTPQSGSFRLSFNGQTTAALANGATAMDVQNALNALSTIGGVGGSVTVTGTGTAMDPYVVTFGGTLANVDVNAIQSVGGFTITFSGALSNSNQNQLLMTSYTTSRGYNASAASIQSALEALPTIGTGNVAVTQLMNAFGNTGWELTFQGALANRPVSQVVVVNLSDLIEISNDQPTLGRISVAPSAASFLVGSRLDGTNGLSSGFEFLRDYFGLAQGTANGTASFLALVRAIDQSVVEPLTNSNIQNPFNPGLSYAEYIRVNLLDSSEAAPVVQDEVYTLNEFAPNSGTTNGLIVGKVNDSVNSMGQALVTVTPTTAPSNGVNEVQTVTKVISGATNPGSFSLTFRGQTTSRILQTDTAATVQAKLQALSTIGAGNVTVTDGTITPTSRQWVVTFTGALAQTDVPLLGVFNGVSDAEQPSEIFRYAIVGGDPLGAFSINQTTGEITIADATRLNFEVTPTYRLLVRVTDTSASNQTLSTVVTVDINLNDINEQTTVPGEQLFVEEMSANGTQVGSFSVTDPDRDPPRDYQYFIENGNLIDPMTGQPTFIINPDTGVISVNSNGLLDAAIQPFFDLGVRVVDRGDLATSGSGTIRIIIVDVNTAPPILNDISFTINENSPNTSVVGQLIGQTTESNQTLTYSILSGNTGGAFFLDPNTGFLTVNNTAAVNFEQNPQFELLVRVSDSATPALFDTALVTVFLIDRNEQVDITSAGSPFSVAENTPLGTVVGTVSSSDLDDTASRTQGRTFSIVAGNVGNAFGINASTGQIFVANPSAIDFETRNTYQLAVQVTDIPFPGQTNPATSDIEVDIDINVVNTNDAPVLNDQTIVPNLIEHRTTGTVVGTVVITDQDVTNTHTYQIIGGNIGNAFAINANTGQITVNNPGAVDFAQNPFFNLTVLVTDNGNPALSDTGIVTINLNDDNPPLINDQTFNLNENVPNGTIVSVNGMMVPISLLVPGSGTGTITYSITGGNVGNTFLIDSTGQLLVNSNTLLDFEMNPTFTLQVLVTDSAMPQLADTATITVNLVNVNEDPVITSGNSFTVVENAPNGTVFGTVTAVDPDAGQTLMYSILGGSPIFGIDMTTGQLFVKNSSLVDFETTNGQVPLTIRVQDNGTPQATVLQAVTVNITNVNEPPVITPPANPFATIAENTANGTSVGNVVANDPDIGDTITYSITGGNTNGAFAINAATGEITVANSAALDFETTPSFSLTVTATDNGMLVDTDTFVINLTNVNEPPLIAPQAFSVPENSNPGTIVGQVVASDPEGAMVTFALSATGNTGNAFGITTDGMLFVKNRGPLDAEVNPVFTLTVMVSDAGGLTSMATITVNLNDINDPPVIAPQSFNLAENTIAGTIVGQVAASDPDSPAQTLTYSIIGGNTGNAFGISPSGQLFVMNRAPLDFETNPVFNLTVQVTDNGSPALSSTAVVTVNLTDVNEQPVIAPQQFVVQENANAGTAVGTVVASDPDAGQTLTYAIIGGNTGTAFTINSATGAITVANSTVIDLETNPVFSLIVQVTDNGSPALSSSAVITISVGDLNEPPVVPPQSFNVAENSASGTVVGTVSASDPDLPAQTLSYQIVGGNTGNAFGINTATGQIFVKNRAPLDFETNPIFDLMVQVTDNGSPAQSTVGTVTINLLDANDAPVVPSQSFTLPENSPLGTAVGLVQVNDQDVGQGRSYAIVGGNVGNAFTIDSTNGLLTVRTPAALNFEVNPVITLTVQVTDFGQPRLSSTGVITVNLTNVNEAPVFSPVQQLFTVNENSPVNTVVGTMNVIDPDMGDTRTFAITGGNVNNAFGINATTGEIFVTNPAALDFEALNSFSLSIRVTDAGGLMANGTAKINLANVNDPPVITPATFTINENSNVGTVVGTVTSTDQDAAQLKSYAIIGGNVGNAFTINAANGQITVANKSALDFETTPTFNLQVRVTDNGSPAASSTGMITVNLRNQNDAPVVTPATFAIRTRSGVGTTVGTVVATDQDAGQTRTFSIVSGNTNSTFSINASTGVITVNRSPRLATTFNLVVRATDNGTPAASGQATITILVNSTGTVPLTTANSSSKSSSGTVSTANATATGSAATVSTASTSTTTKKSSTANWWELTN